MRGSVVTANTFPFTITGNRTWGGFQTFQGTTGQSNPTAEFRAASGQTGNLLEFYNASGTKVAYFDQAGNFSSTGAASYASTQVAQGATGIGFSVKGNASNSSDLQQWQSSTGAVLLGITSAGALYGGSGLTVGGNLVLSGATGLQVRDDNSTADPGVPWLRSDGSTLVLNPHGSGEVRLAYDVMTLVRVGNANGFQLRADNATADPGVPWLRSDGTSLTINPHGAGTIRLGADNAGGGTTINGGMVVSASGHASVVVSTPTAAGVGSNLLLTETGATTPSKTLRTLGGHFQIVNNAYTTAVFDVSDTGAVTLSGSLSTSSPITLTGSGGTLAVGGTLTVTGLTTLSGNVSVGGAAAFTLRGDGAATNPGIRGSAGGLIVSGSPLYLNWDSPGQAVNINGPVNTETYDITTAGITVSGTTTLNGAVNTGSGVLTVGAGGLFNSGATQLTTLNASQGSSLQALTTNGAVVHNNVGRLSLSGVPTFGSGITNANLAMGVTINGVNYWLPLYT